MLTRTLLALVFLPLPGQSPVPPVVAPIEISGGMGDLLVAPTRVVMDNRKRTAELNLSNIGLVKATYRISLVRMEMDEAGSFKEVPSINVVGQVSPESLVRFSPREVTLEPQESQTVRLQARKPAELQAGEYRIHMIFRAIPPTPEPPPESTPSGPPKGISIKLIPVYGLAIPVIVRQGETSADVTLADLALDPQGRTILFRLERRGNQSVYGDLKAVFVPKVGPKETVCEANGVAVYTPNPARRVLLAVTTVAPGGRLAHGRLHLTYSLPPREGGAMLAEGFLDVP